MANQKKKQQAQREAQRASKARREIEAQRGVQQSIKRAAKSASGRMKFLILNGMNAAEQEAELSQESKWALTFKLLYFLLIMCSSVLICGGWVPTADWPVNTSVNRLIAVMLMLYAAPLLACFASNYIYHLAWKLIITLWPRCIISFLVREKSIREYVTQKPAVKDYRMENGDTILICTREGLLLWIGFLNVVIGAYKNNKSWCGTFSEQHLKMLGSHCRIIKKPIAAASFKNLLLDFSTLAKLLLPFYTDLNGVAEIYIEKLYDSMTNPPITETSSESEQNSFIKYLTGHLALCSARQRRILLTYICRFFNSLGVAKKAQFMKAVTNIKIIEYWPKHAQTHPLLLKVLLFDRYNAANTKSKYAAKPEQVFRFMRNFFEHGGDSDFFTGQQYVRNMDDLDHIGAHLFSSFAVKLSYEILMRPHMADVVDYAWRSYGV